MVEKAPSQTGLQRGCPKRSPRDQRVPAELLRRLDAYTTQVQAIKVYMRFSRADVLRMVLDRG